MPNRGGSYEVPPAEEGKKPEKFVLKEKISEMLKYALPLVDNFPRRNRKLADTLRDSLLEMLRLAIRLEKKIHKKTTLDDLDIELAVVKEFVIVASDKDYCGPKYAPPLTMHQREVWSRYNAEIGNLIGGYKKYVEGKQKD
jgi:hypothetical protein